MVKADDIAAVVVTRGDVDLEPTLEPLRFLREVVVWDNSQREDLAVYGRYAAIEEAKGDAILVVDDDVELSAEAVTALRAAYKPGVLTANMPPEHQRRYPDSALVGFGAIFDRDLPERAFERFFPEMLNPDPADPEWGRYSFRSRKGYEIYFESAQQFHRTCDIVFSALTPRKIIDVPFTMLPHTWAENRMYRTPGNTEERTHVLDAARRVRRAVA